jgi:hypothetical protein
MASIQAMQKCTVFTGLHLQYTKVNWRLMRTSWFRYYHDITHLTVFWMSVGTKNCRGDQYINCWSQSLRSWGDHSPDPHEGGAYVNIRSSSVYKNFNLPGRFHQVRMVAHLLSHSLIKCAEISVTDLLPPTTANGYKVKLSIPLLKTPLRIRVE